MFSFATLLKSRASPYSEFSDRYICSKHSISFLRSAKTATLATAHEQQLGAKCSCMIQGRLGAPFWMSAAAPERRCCCCCQHWQAAAQAQIFVHTTEQPTTYEAKGATATNNSKLIRVGVGSSFPTCLGLITYKSYRSVLLGSPLATA